MGSNAISNLRSKIEFSITNNVGLYYEAWTVTVVSDVGVVVDDARLVGAVDVDRRQAVADGRRVGGRRFRNARGGSDGLNRDNWIASLSRFILKT